MKKIDISGETVTLEVNAKGHLKSSHPVYRVRYDQRTLLNLTKRKFFKIRPNEEYKLKVLDTFYPLRLEV
jgi:hypothetical protein